MAGSSRPGLAPLRSRWACATPWVWEALPASHGTLALGLEAEGRLCRPHDRGTQGSSVVTPGRACDPLSKASSSKLVSARPPREAPAPRPGRRSLAPRADPSRRGTHWHTGADLCRRRYTGTFQNGVSHTEPTRPGGGAPRLTLPEPGEPEPTPPEGGVL